MKTVEGEVVVGRGRGMERVNALAQLLDSSIPLGKTGYSIGLDPLLGLIPGFGDALGAAISSYIVIEGARLGASRWTLFRMMANIGLEMLVGVIPIFGDLFDFAFKANKRNVAILNAAKLEPRGDVEGRIKSTLMILALAFVAMLGASVYLALYVLNAVIQSFS